MSRYIVRICLAQVTPPLPALHLLPCKGWNNTSGLDFEHRLTKFFGIISNETSPEPQSPNPFLQSNTEKWLPKQHCGCVFSLPLWFVQQTQPILQPHFCSWASQGSASWSRSRGFPLSCASFTSSAGRVALGASPAGTIGREGGPDGTLSAVLSGSLFQAYLYWTLDREAFCLACKKQLKCIPKSHRVKQMHEVHIWLTTLIFFMCVCICIYLYV